MISINKEKCIGCKLCVHDCQCSDIKIENEKAVPLNNVCLSCGHCVAICPQNAVSLNEYNMDEVIEYNKDTFHINPESVLNAIKFRRSTRNFKNTPVEKNILEKIIEAGRFTPSGGNRQPLSFIVVRDNMDILTRTTLDVLNDMGCRYVPDINDPLDSNRRRYATMWKMMHRQYANKGIDLLFFNAPAMIIILSDNNLSLNPLVDGGLAASNMQTMADASDLGVCFNGFFKFAYDDERIRTLLNISDSKTVVTSLLLGYTDNRYCRTVPRKEAEVNWF